MPPLPKALSPISASIHRLLLRRLRSSTLPATLLPPINHPSTPRWGSSALFAPAADLLRRSTYYSTILPAPLPSPPVDSWSLDYSSYITSLRLLPIPPSLTLDVVPLLDALTYPQTTVTGPLTTTITTHRLTETTVSYRIRLENRSEKAIRGERERARESRQTSKALSRVMSFSRLPACLSLTRVHYHIPSPSSQCWAANGQ